MSAECSWTQSSGMLLSARDVRELAEAAGIRPSKQRGQNFVMDPNTVRTIVQRAGIEPGQSVLEVGPGLGSLTLGLLEAGADVVAIELDRGLAQLLPATLASRGVEPERFQLIHADALRVTELPDLPHAGQPTALVANLPYNVATPILLSALQRFEQLAHRGPGLTHLWRAQRQGRLVRPTLPRRQDLAAHLLARAQRRLGPGAPGPA